MAVVMQPGEVWLADLDPTVGSEIRKRRPCVVVSPVELNQHLRTVLVAPLTTGARPAAFRVELSFQGKQGRVLVDQLRCLDTVRLVERLGAVRPATLQHLREVLQRMFAA